MHTIKLARAVAMVTRVPGSGTADPKVAIPELKLRKDVAPGENSAPLVSELGVPLGSVRS